MSNISDNDAKHVFRTEDGTVALCLKGEVRKLTDPLFERLMRTIEVHPAFLNDPVFQSVWSYMHPIDYTSNGLEVSVYATVTKEDAEGDAEVKRSLGLVMELGHWHDGEFMTHYSDEVGEGMLPPDASDASEASGASAIDDESFLLKAMSDRKTREDAVGKLARAVMDEMFLGSSVSDLYEILMGQAAAAAAYTQP